ncbi:hypothetical protein M011DRAFT_476814 [Sporormia fimetaria CBS 119925]|uniref:Uncharacterized protein n=1 Tax=Sporormia fimetaria CBS 119925 TaxID=1340428 RepID=A0A6A6VDE7_9PLEO|nr:hypothetical protein M011DRAFT_476814 [Sporormia fimetaria CBS 119925]
MTVTNSYPSISSSPRPSTDSHRTSLSTQRTRSDSSVPVHSSSDLEHSTSLDTTSTNASRRTEDYGAVELDPEVRLRKRDYAVEISRIMGRQLVAAMNKGRREGAGAGSPPRG